MQMQKEGEGGVEEEGEEDSGDAIDPLPALADGHADVQAISRGLVRQFRVLSPCLTLPEAERILRRMAATQRARSQANGVQGGIGTGQGTQSSDASLFGRLGAISVGKDIFLPRASMLVFDTTLERPEVTGQLIREGEAWREADEKK